MTKQLKKVKISIIFLILFGSSFVTLCSNVKSGPLDQIYECTPNLVILYDDSLLQKPVKPFDDATLIPVKVELDLIGPAVDIVLSKLGGQVKYIVNIEMAEVPEGCQASIIPSLLLIDLPTEDIPVSVNATISITVNQFVPALSQRKLGVRMVSESIIGNKAILINSGNYTQDIPFIVGYYSQLNFNYKDGNVRSIQPDGIADFTFEIQNFGNGATNVISEIVDLPDGWSTEIVRSTILGSELVGSSSSKIISLRVKPPTDFGYHEDRQIIKVSMLPVCVDNPDYQGEPHYLYFIVQSKGFFTPGFELGILLFAFIFVLIPIWKRKKTKNGKNDFGGKR
jgi:hypothetical protein